MRVKVKQKAGNSIIFILAFYLIVSGCATKPAARTEQNRLDKEDWSGMKLWYEAPAQEWTQALPVGNGRLGAMIFGGTENERLQFNEDTLWTGRPHEYQHGGAVAYRPIVRKLLFEGKQREAEKLAGEQMMSVPLRQEKYQPFGDLRLNFPGHDQPSDYRRELDIDSAIATVIYRIGDARFTRKVFCSYPDQVIIVRLSCDKPGQLTFSVKLDSPHPDTQTLIVDNTLALRGQLQDSINPQTSQTRPSVLKFEARLTWSVSGGKIMAVGDALEITGADSVILV